MNALCICTSFHEEIRKSKYPPPDDKYLLDIFCHTTTTRLKSTRVIKHSTKPLSSITNLLTPYITIWSESIFTHSIFRKKICKSHIWMSQFFLNIFTRYITMYLLKIYQTISQMILITRHKFY